MKMVQLALISDDSLFNPILIAVHIVHSYIYSSDFALDNNVADTLSLYSTNVEKMNFLFNWNKKKTFCGIYDFFRIHFQGFPLFCVYYGKMEENLNE